MAEENPDSDYVDLTFYDVQGLGTLPDPLNKVVGLMTKISMGVIMVYFSLNELVIELKRYRQNSVKGDN